MSSSEDMFSDSPEMDPDNFTPPSSLKTNSGKSSQVSKLESTPSLNPTPDLQIGNFQISPEILSEESSGVRSESISVKVKEVKPVNMKINVEFFDESGEKTFSRVSTDPEIINIVSSMLRSSDPDHSGSASRLLKMF